jgi:cleavage and polyadenylation specificity factor subunit 4|uniref:Uncharacterized protein n=1 Tax=Arabidopsis thaliana TaxID=3702 RepID=Q45GH5_ARATH|nr:hypothetical protein At5g18440 [Arabidopsis thaliana]
MRPPYNSFQPQARPYRPQHQLQQQQQINGFSNHQQQQHNGYQNPMNANQLGMMNPQMMNNPMMGHNMPMPNMPIHPQFFNNMPQQLPQFAMPNHINQLLPNLLGNLQFAVANSNLMGHSLPNFFQPSLEPHAFSSRPQLNSFNSLPYPPVPNPHQNHQSGPPGFSEPRPQGQSVDNTNGSGPNGNDFRNKFPKHQNFKGPGQGYVPTTYSPFSDLFAIILVYMYSEFIVDSRDLSCIKQIMARESLDSIRITGAKGTIIR